MQVSVLNGAIIGVIAALLLSVSYNVHQSNKKASYGTQASQGPTDPVVEEVPLHLNGMPDFYTFWDAKRAYGLYNKRLAQGFMIMPAKRNDFGWMLESLSMTVGVELGVKKGEFAKHLLYSWPSCKKYYLVDLWEHQENYEDDANVTDKPHMQNYDAAKKNLMYLWEKTVYMKNNTVEAAKVIPDGLGFVYLNARHDYCGVMEDMETYWPKLKPGGIMAGHDYASAAQVYNLTQKNWSLCMNGTVNHGAVMGAVNAFALKHNAFLGVTWDDNLDSKSWLMRKHHACLTSPKTKMVTKTGRWWQ